MLPEVVWQTVTNRPTPGWLSAAFGLAAALLPFADFTLCWWLPGQTLGQMLFGIAVRRHNGEEDPTLVQAALRAALGLTLSSTVDSRDAGDPLGLQATGLARQGVPDRGALRRPAAEDPVGGRLAYLAQRRQSPVHPELDHPCLTGSGSGDGPSVTCRAGGLAAARSGRTR